MKLEDQRNCLEMLGLEEISNGFGLDLLELRCRRRGGLDPDRVTPTVTSLYAGYTRSFEHCKALLQVSRRQREVNKATPSTYLCLLVMRSWHSRICVMGEIPELTVARAESG